MNLNEKELSELIKLLSAEIDKGSDKEDFQIDLRLKLMEERGYY